VREARLVGVATIREQPVDVWQRRWRRSSMRPWSPPVVCVLGFRQVGWRIVEERRHLACLSGPVSLESQQMAAVDHDGRHIKATIMIKADGALRSALGS
jgi:hypothetical protein